MKKIFYVVIVMTIFVFASGCQNQQTIDPTGNQDGSKLPSSEVQKKAEMHSWKIVGNIDNTVFTIDTQGNLWEFETVEQKAHVKDGKIIFQNPKNVCVGTQQVMILSQENEVYMYGTQIEAVLGYSITEAKNAPVKIYSDVRNMQYLDECGTLIIETTNDELLISGTPFAQMPENGEYVAGEYGDAVAVFPTVKIVDAPPIQQVYTHARRSSFDESTCFILTVENEIYTLKNGEFVRTLENVQAVSKGGPSVLAVLKNGEVYLLYDYEEKCERLDIKIPDAMRLQAFVDFYFYWTAHDDLYCFGTAYQDGMLTDYHERPSRKLIIETQRLPKIAEDVKKAEMDFTTDRWRLLILTKGGTLRLLSTDITTEGKDLATNIVDFSVASEESQDVYALNNNEELFRYNNSTEECIKVSDNVVALFDNALFLIK